MKPRHLATLICAFAAVTMSKGVTDTALAQPVAPQPGTPMVKPPPAAASGTASATNPDNMPVKKPDNPTNDPISRAPPASATEAK
jgi:hypothetical protein